MADGTDAARRAAERAFLAALRRLHRAEPLVADQRIDAVLRRVRDDAARDRRPAGHRGAPAAPLDDRAMLDLVDELAATGRLRRRGRRVALPDHAPLLDGAMRGRVDRLLAGLREAGAAPPRVEPIAGRLGIPPAVIEQLRRAGELVALGPGIDYPREVHAELRDRVREIAARGPLTVGLLARQLGTSRRHAEALVEAHRRARRRARRAPR